MDISNEYHYIKVDIHIKIHKNYHLYHKRFIFLIVCYRDDNGKIICEGFDESPRFHQQLHIIQGLIFSYQSSMCNQPLFVVLVLYCNLKRNIVMRN